MGVRHPSDTQRIDDQPITTTQEAIPPPPIACADLPDGVRWVSDTFVKLCACGTGLAARRILKTTAAKSADFLALAHGSWQFL